MTFITTFITVFFAIALIAVWFKFADYIGDRFNSPTFGFTLALGVPIAFVIALASSLN